MVRFFLYFRKEDKMLIRSNASVSVYESHNPNVHIIYSIRGQNYEKKTILKFFPLLKHKKVLIRKTRFIRSKFVIRKPCMDVYMT